MRKFLVVVAVMVMLLTLTSCVTVTVENDSENSEGHIIEYIEGKDVIVDEEPYIAIFTNYTNNSGETAMPCDYTDVKAFQNGVELTIIVPSGTKVEGAVQCDTYVQSGTTVKTVWLFERVDNSPVSVELSNGERYEVG